MTRQALADAHWPRAQANEAIYRIEKEFGLHDTLPSPARIRSEEELKEEEARDQELMRQSGQSFQAMDMNLAP
ncbi:MAG: hypothetical protein BWZ10_02436 [candidate division BRC1 bacterium ADurb.BinA364]|nr:MAG: hypothetical protein BWZ10_02436 [candidate division BRC1 bacterium ADurb.BinA364]